MRCRKDPVFGFDVPETCEGVPSEILDPANTWGSRVVESGPKRLVAVPAGARP